MPDPLRELERRLEAATKTHWTYRLDQLGRPGELPFWRVRVPARGRQHTRVCLASGIHGDEPAGIEAMLRLLEGQELPPGVAVDCFPCMNPQGTVSGQREDAAGSDLNRLFGAFAPPETIGWFQAATEDVSYDLYIDFHEDNRSQGFYVFESEAGEDRMAGMIVQALKRSHVPLERGEHLRALVAEDGFERYGPFRVEEGVAIHDLQSLPKGPQRGPEGSEPLRVPLPGEGMPQAVYMRACRGAHILTLESPSELPFEQRVAMHLTALRAIFRRLRARANFAALSPHREWLASEPSGRRR